MVTPSWKSSNAASQPHRAGAIGQLVPLPRMSAPRPGSLTLSAVVADKPAVARQKSPSSPSIFGFLRQFRTESGLSISKRPTANYPGFRLEVLTQISPPCKKEPTMQRLFLSFVVVFSCCLATAAQDAKEYVNRGNAWGNKGEYEKAIAEYTDALGIDPVRRKPTAIEASPRGKWATTTPPLRTIPKP